MPTGSSTASSRSARSSSAATEKRHSKGPTGPPGSSSRDHPVLVLELVVGVGQRAAELVLSGLEQRDVGPVDVGEEVVRVLRIDDVPRLLREPVLEDLGLERPSVAGEDGVPGDPQVSAGQIADL